MNQDFDSNNCKINGTQIIEAGAGTGKTFNIENIFVRMVFNNFPVESILVVTFTDAATKELKNRIRNFLIKIKVYFEERENQINKLENSELDRIRELKEIKKGQNKENIKQNVNLALSNFDEASIFTIHGFCYKILNDYSFESGLLFNTELETNPEYLIEDIIEDFWRLENYNNEFLYNSLFRSNNITINSLKSFIKSFIRHPDAKLEPEIKLEYEKFKNIYKKLYKNWDREHITDLLNKEYVKKAYKEKGLTKKLDAVEDFLRGNFLENLDYIKYFSQEKLNNEALLKGYKKKGFYIENHPFFCIVDELLNVESTICKFGIYIKQKCFKYFKKEYKKRKAQLNIQTFDDLLIQTKNKLYERNSLLLESVSKKFYGVLIDEFQDTDKIQYQIFKKIFIKNNKPTFLIGDPKQAIYSFRGGDIYTYQKAKNENPNIKTLSTNRRSAPNLVRSFNKIFEENKDNSPPFLTENIGYKKSETIPGNDKLFENENIIKAPFKVHFFNGEYTKEELSEVIYETTCKEIQNILSNKSLNIEENGYYRTIKPKDIAVLVTSHKDAKDLKSSLDAYQIPSILQSTGSVFDSTEAEHLEYLLHAIAEPKSTKIMKGALLTQLLNYRLCDIYFGYNQNELEEEHNLTEIYQTFQNSNKKWKNKSFIEMFNYLFSFFDIKNNLLTQKKGKRKFTNLMHLIELLHQKEAESKLGINELINWLSEQRNPDTRENRDEHEIRLETEEDTVKFMTVHKSKGLEYPIVFCPTLWRRSAISNSKKNIFEYHNEEGDYILNISNDNEMAKSKNQTEVLEELIRIFYVAITRAQYMCFIQWGNLKNDKQKTSSLNYIFNRDRTIEETNKENKVERIKEVSSPGQDIKMFCENSENIELLHGTKFSDSQTKDIEEKNYKQELKLKKSFKNIAPIIDNKWVITSFSGLFKDASAKDYDQTDNYKAQPEDYAKDTLDIFHFDAGAKTGNCWHEIFEQIDFMADYSQIEATIKNQLKAYRFISKNPSHDESIKLQSVCDMVKNVLNTYLSTEEQFRLRDLDENNKLTELEFYFPIKENFSYSKLINILKTYFRESEFPEKIQDMAYSSLHGFMNGFIDLVFRYNNKYYIVDWKSNIISRTPESFNKKNLTKEVYDNLYFLQYLIYTIALNKFLSSKGINYDYEKNFGGIFYIFLRGVDENPASSRGIYYDRPNENIIKDLEEIFSQTKK